MKNILIAFAALYTMINIAGCTKGKQLVPLTGASYTVTGAADGAQMVPATGVSAAGTFSGWYDEQTNVLTFTLGWTNIFTTAKDALTSVKFYSPAVAGTNGTLNHTVVFSNANATGSINLGLAGYAELSTTERDAMYSGKCYYVICTQNYPNGIIRGQLIAKLYEPNVPAVNPVTSVAFAGTNKTLLKAGDTTTLKAQALPTYATNRALKWSSSDNSIVTVSQTGKITGLLKGLAIITAESTDGTGIKATQLVVVDMTVQDLSRTGWTVTASDEKVSDGGGKDGILDGNLNTYWHSMWSPDVPLPHWLLIDMKQDLTVATVRVLRRTVNTDTKTVVVETSMDGVSFTSAGSITAFDGTSTGIVSFAPVKAHYIKLTYPDSNRPPYVNTVEVYVGAYQ